MRIAGFVVAVLTALPAAASGEGPIAWRDWSAGVFEQAEQEEKLVFLDLEAVWCHWCHVMDEVTYRDPAVVALLEEHFIAVKVDQNAHPELSRRYENWGWPALVVFDAAGRELWRNRGYIEPAELAPILDYVHADPEPVRASLPRVAAGQAASLDDPVLGAIDRRFAFAYDEEVGAWGTGHKFLQADALDYALALAMEGDPLAEEMARQTLDAGLGLIDPVWGGIFQYSDRNRWDSIHFEKIVPSQAAALRLYALAWRRLEAPEHLAAARAVEGYAAAFLTAPDGAFFASQDADVGLDLTGHDFYAKDDAGRRAGPMPAVDTSIYTLENGLMIVGLAALADATGDAATLGRATAAARWIMANRALPGGGFSHGDPAEDPVAYLADNLAIGEAFLALHRSTGDRGWLDAAAAEGRFLVDTFSPDGFGFAASAAPDGVGLLAEPFKHRDDNTAAVRFFNLLGHYTGEPLWGEAARTTMAYLLASPDATPRAFWPGLLQAARELAADPLHVTVVGARDDPAAAALHAAALAFPAAYARVEWWDRAEGPLPNADVEFPELGEAAAFSCVDRLCSLPVFDAAEVGEHLRALLARGAPLENQARQ